MMSTYRIEDAATEERIAAILSEAQHQMQHKQHHEKVRATDSYHHCHQDRQIGWVTPYSAISFLHPSLSLQRVSIPVNLGMGNI